MAPYALLAAYLLAACSREAPQAHGIEANRASSRNPCERRMLTAADLSGILNAPITAYKGVPGDVHSCTFETSGFPSITVTVRPGRGRETVATWLAGKMPLRAEPLAGVGDSAVWQADLREVIAQRGDLLCDIQAAGAPRDFTVEVRDLSGRLGALCDRIFARYAAS